MELAAGVAQGLKPGPVNQKVAGSILSQATCLDCGPGPWLGVCERQPNNVALPLFLSPFPLSKK